MPEISFEQAANELMKAFVSDVKISPLIARCSGYDVHALQHCMNVFRPEISALPGYKPLAEWLSDREDTVFTRGEEETRTFESVIQLMQLYVVEFAEDNRRTQIVGAYVSQGGEYLVAITEKPEDQRGNQHSKELEARIIPCESAAELAQVLNPLLLQIERYERYLERYRIYSPLTFIAEKLQRLCKTQITTAESRVSALRKINSAMQLATEIYIT